MTALPTDDLAVPLGRVAPPRRPRARSRFGVARTLRYLALLLFLLLVLIPVYVLLVTSFKGIGDASPASAVHAFCQFTRVQVCGRDQARAGDASPIPLKLVTTRTDTGISTRSRKSSSAR